MNGKVEPNPLWVMRIREAGCEHCSKFRGNVNKVPCGNYYFIDMVEENECPELEPMESGVK